MIEALRVDSTHHYAYKPNGETKATVTGIFWDKEKGRIAVSLLYDNGETDWIPAEEIEGLTNKPNLYTPTYSILNRLTI